ncbi:MAG: DUF3842 family protein [Erysipelotrichaceae bacterium]|nr:DUF3842 family protein [Erysipelotrichaceae bacterium]MBR3693178.1 DUF3842 family protein [Erysipelotrichales bacterium]
MKIVVIDGQGGRIGKMIIEEISDMVIGHEVVAIGTNALATSSMIKGGATLAATGENPVVVNVRDADVVIGPIGIIVADSLLGEVTEKMAVAVASSKAKKILVPISKCNQVVVGVQELPLSKYIELVREQLKRELGL